MIHSIKLRRCLYVLIALLAVLLALPLQAMAADYTPIAGVKISTNSNASVSSSVPGEMTITVTSTKYAARTGTLTFYNTTAKDGILGFHYEVTAGSGNLELTIDDTKISATSGDFSKLVTANSGSSFQVSIKANNGFLSANSVEVKLSKFVLASDQATNSLITYDSSLGSVLVDGNTIASGTTVSVSPNGTTFKAVPKSNAVFLGWTNPDTGAIISAKEEDTLNFAGDTPMQAVFTSKGGTGYFRVGMDKLFDDLQDAIDFAVTNATKTIIVACDATLTGNYTIPNGVTLLIPFNNDDTCYTTAPGIATSYKQPTAYRTLTLAENASLTVGNGGAISLSAHQCSTMGSNGSPSGPAGFLKMEENSKITVQSGGNLYAWGFITGSDSASVTIQSGGNVYENFQIADWRGGSGSTAMVVDSQALLSTLKAAGKIGNDELNPGVFPMSQYYVQNIEVPLTLKKGSKEHGATAMDVAVVGITAVSVPFIGDADDPDFKGMFRIVSGSITKHYDPETDRMLVDIDGELNMADMYIAVTEIDLGLTKVPINIDSTKYTLPLNGNISVNINKGSTVNIKQDMSMLPGSQISIAKGAILNITSGYKIYAYDADDWGNYTYAGKFKSVKYAPGQEYTRTEVDLVDASIQINGTLNAYEGHLYSTNGGGNIYSTATGTAILTPDATTTTLPEATQSGTTVSYVTTTVKPAVLKNEDSTELNSGAIADKTEYNYDHHTCGHETADTTVEDGVWYAGKHEETTATVDATCTTAGSITVECTCGHKSVTTIPALGHTEVIDAAKAATCTETGLTEGKHCSVCNEVLVAQEEVAALGHTEVVDVAVAATCTESGLTEGSHCATCGEVLVAQEEVAALGHTEVTDAAVAATCTETGLTEGKHCSVCNEVIVAQTEVAAKGHTEVTDAAVAATCTETGLTEGKHCSVCGTVTVAQTEVAALGHTEVTDAAVAATCTETGLTEGKHCSICNAVLVAQEVVAAKGHTEVTDAAVAPTCTETGLTEGKHCSVCNEVIVAQTEVAAKGHTEVTDAAVDATCIATGLTEGKHCSVCNEVIVAQEEVAALGHTEVVDAAVAATCTETGLTEGKHCSVCNEVLVAQEVVAALGHKYEDTVTYPTYSTAGYTTFKCSACGHNYQTNFDAAETTDKKYQILAEAVVDAGENGTVTLLSNITGDVKIAKFVTIEKGEYTAKIEAGTGFNATDAGTAVKVTPKIAAVNLAVNDGLDMYFYVRKDAVVDKTKFSATVTKDFAEGHDPATVTMEYTGTEWDGDDSTYYRFAFSDISAKEMMDNVTVHLFYNDVEIDACVQTVQGYAIDALEAYKTYTDKESEALKKALMDMLQYGASAQEQFKYNTGAPANVAPANVNTLENHKSYITTALPDCDDDIKEYSDNVAGVTVSATNTLMFTFYFNVKDTTGMYAIVSYIPYGSDQSVTLPRIDAKDFYKREEGLYGVDVKTLSIVDGRQQITCTLYNADGTEAGSAVDSIEGYSCRNQSNGSIYMNMMRFVDSARHYFDLKAQG